jgi:NitT/TauT family transport system substrate-binding protein
VPDTANWVAQSKVDFSLGYSSYFVAAIDAGEPVVLLAGVHVGCFELFAGEGRGATKGLKKRRLIAANTKRAGPYG